jgi:hypothetical protein
MKKPKIEHLKPLELPYVYCPWCCQAIKPISDTTSSPHAHRCPQCGTYWKVYKESIDLVG